MVQPELDAKQHRLKVTLPSRPVWLNADPVRIGQVLGNLLSNAGKYTAPGGRLALRVECTDSATVSFYVRDNGVGIPSESLEQIFEPFCQLAIPAGQQREGLGVGLALVRQIVQAHGGHVEARSIGPGQGSEFVVQLPVATETPAAAPREPDPAPAAPPAARVLIVDDNIHITGALTALLKEYGWPHVRAVNDGAAALELARSFRPQVVLIDIGMPGMDGNELARQLRAAYPDGAMHLIAMTGFGQEEDQRRAEAAGFDQYLLKPVQRIELQAMIASLPTSPAAG